MFPSPPRIHDAEDGDGVRGVLVDDGGVFEDEFVNRGSLLGHPAPDFRERLDSSKGVSNHQGIGILLTGAPRLSGVVPNRGKILFCPW